VVLSKNGLKVVLDTKRYQEKPEDMPMNNKKHNMITYIKHFNEVGITDIPQVGGKNASLGEMYRNLSDKGIAVPDGFALTADAYWTFTSGIQSTAEGRKWLYCGNRNVSWNDRSDDRVFSICSVGPYKMGRSFVWI